MGANDNVHLARGHAAQGLRNLLGTSEPRELGQPNRPAREPVLEGLHVLLSQQGGGAEHGHLTAIHHCNEGRPKGHLGLAKAHVSANQAVHGLVSDHVLNHGMNGGELVGRLFESEAVCKSLVVGGLEAE